MFAELRNGWHIISPGKSFTVYAATAMEKADWMMHVNRCVQNLRLKSAILFSFVFCFCLFFLQYGLVVGFVVLPTWWPMISGRPEN